MVFSRILKKYIIKKKNGNKLLSLCVHLCGCERESKRAYIQYLHYTEKDQMKNS